jgi:PAS domain S-box-containing protein
MAQSEGTALLDLVVEQVCRVTGAGGAAFCEWDEQAGTILTLAARGTLRHPDLVPGRALRRSTQPWRGGLLAAGEPSVLAAGDRAAGEYLERARAAWLVTVPVVDRPGGAWFLDVFYPADAERPGGWEVGHAADLAPLGAAALYRDEWGRELAAAAAEGERMQGELVASERQFREFLDGVRLVAAITDMDGCIAFANEYLAELTGWPRDELLRRSWEETLVPEDAREEDQRVRRRLERGRMSHYEGRLLTRSGDERLISWNTTLLRSGDGTPTGVALLGDDVTEERRGAHALRESDARRQQVLESVLRFEQDQRARIATELHDDTIQVMTAALISIDRLGRALAEGNHARTEVALASVRDSLTKAVERARHLTFELRPPLLERHGLAPALRDLAEEAASEAGFVVELEADLERYPFAVEDLAFRTVAEAVSNARKHSRASRLEVRVAERDGNLEGTVRDDGRGFDVGQALDRSRMRLHLGLDAMAERVELAGGHVEIASQPGAGATISFSLPIPPPEPGE